MATAQVPRKGKKATCSGATPPVGKCREFNASTTNILAFPPALDLAVARWEVWAGLAGWGGAWWYPGPAPTTGALSGTCSVQVRSLRRWELLFSIGRNLRPVSAKQEEPSACAHIPLWTIHSQLLARVGDLLCHSRFPQTAHKIWDFFFFFFKESRYKNKRNPYTLKIYWKLPPQMRYHLSRPPTPKLQTSKYICF